MPKLKEESLKWALRSIQEYSDTYIFPMPFEYGALVDREAEVIGHLKAQDFLKEGIRDYRTALTPKSVKGFRISTQLDPLDSIRSQAIIYELEREIEDARVPKGQNIVYSFRLKPNLSGRLYDPKYNWDAFRAKAVSIAESEQYSHVLLTDISDFYPSIYLHDIETVFDELVKKAGKQSHAQFLINMVRAMHLLRTHKGIPVGPQFSRPIAELILDDVDRSLIKTRTKYLRYVDDFVVFAKSETDAYKKLAALAQLLYDTRHLKLNELKTEILEVEKFLGRFRGPEERTEGNIIDNFNDLLKEVGLSTNPYEQLEPDDLDEEQWERLRSANLEKVLAKELEEREPDSFLVSFLLANLARIDNTEIAELVLEETNISKLFPKLHTIINYLERVRGFSEEQRTAIGSRVLDLITNSFVGQIDFNRMWLLTLFTRSNEWDNEGKFEKLMRRFVDPSTSRELYLALARSNAVKFFRANKSQNLNTDSWVRRAFIAGMSCLPAPERNPWFKARSLRSRDFLDTIVESWVSEGLPPWNH